MRVNSNRPPKPEQTLEGYVLTDSGDKAISHVVGSFFGAIFLGAGLFMFLSDGSLFAKFFSVPFIGLGGLFVVVPMVLLWRIRKLKPGQLRGLIMAAQDRRYHTGYLPSSRQARCGPNA